MSNISRRNILTGSAALTGGMFLPKGLPLWALADEMPTVTAHPTFIDYSETLTGIKADQLQAALSQDDYSLANKYYELLLKASDDYTMGIIFDNYKTMKNRGNTQQEIANAFLAPGDKDMMGFRKPFNRLCIMLWLFGVWYGGTEYEKGNGTFNNILKEGYRTDFVVSSRAYINGWGWRAAQAHPMGFSQFKFGSWANQPPSLSEYGITV